MKPVIGIIPLVDVKQDSIWMLPGYMDGISQAGGLPFMMPLTEDQEDIDQLVDMCDGILFTGGQDVSPEMYDEKPMLELIDCYPALDHLESKIFKKAYKQNKPIFGICRGIQFINVAMGGSLYQDLPMQFCSDINHQQTVPYDQPWHKVRLIEDTPLAKLLGTDKIAVNSYHHQAVHVPAYGLTPMAITADDLIEAIYDPEKRFVWAVQWHPECRLENDENSRKLFQTFVDACKPFEVLDIEEDVDFGCEETKEVMAVVTMKDFDGNEVKVKQPDKLLYARKIKIGDKVIYDVDGYLRK